MVRVQTAEGAHGGKCLRASFITIRLHQFLSFRGGGGGG